MRKLLLAFALSTASLVSAETLQLAPMHEEDPHFIHYRCLNIDGSIHTIESILEQIKSDEMYKDLFLEMVEDQIKIIKFNLGYPTEF